MSDDDTKGTYGEAIWKYVNEKKPKPKPKGEEDEEKEEEEKKEE